MRNVSAKITHWDEEKKFGFAKMESGNVIYFHITGFRIPEIRRWGVFLPYTYNNASPDSTPQVGQEVRCIAVDAKKGRLKAERWCIETTYQQYSKALLQQLQRYRLVRPLSPEPQCNRLEIVWNGRGMESLNGKPLPRARVNEHFEYWSGKDWQYCGPDPFGELVGAVSEALEDVKTV